MVIEIQSIENKALRKAAEKADETGNLDNKLDASEMVVFAKEAYKNGCSSTDILSVTGESEDAKLAKTVSDIQAIEAKEKELAMLVADMETKKQEYDKTRADSKKYNTQVQIGTGIVGGLVTGGTILGGIIGIFDLINSGKFASNWGNRFANAFEKGVELIFGATNLRNYLTLGAIAIAGGVVAAIFAGKALAEKTDLFGLKSHNVKVAQKAGEDYKRENIEPLTSQIKNLEQEIEEMKQTFNEQSTTK